MLIRGVRFGLVLAAVALALLSAVGFYAVFAAPAWLDPIPALAETAERVREGRYERIRDLALVCGLATAGINALAFLALWGTNRFWLNRDAAPERPELAPAARRPGRSFALLAAGAMLVGGLLAWPRLDQSFWDDEVKSVRTAIHGSHELDDARRPFFQAVNLGGTLWSYETPNNHVPYSLLARASLAIWRAGSGAPADQCDEVAVRIPAWLIGIASIGAIALSLWQIGFPNAGVLAAWILALHPWHMRYASEARGYTLVALLVSLLAMWLVLALRRGTWGRWALFGATQFLLLWTYPAAVFVVAVANAGALLALARDRGGLHASPSLARLLVVGAAGAMLWVQLMAPNVAQLVTFVDDDPFPGVVLGYWKRIAAFLFVGMPWRKGSFDPNFPDLRHLVEWSPLLTSCAIAFAALLGGLGAVRLLRTGGVRALLVWIFVLPGPLFFWFSWVRDQYMFERYLLFALPGWVMLLSLGLDALVERADQLVDRADAVLIRKAVGPAAVVLFLLGFAALSHPARSRLWDRPFQPLRESVAATRGLLAADDPANERFLTASFYQAPRYYDPALHRIETPAELQALMDRADREGQTLFLNIGRLDMAWKAKPKLTATVMEADRFERIGPFYGFERSRTRDVFRYRGAASLPSARGASRAPKNASIRRQLSSAADGS